MMQPLASSKGGFPQRIRQNLTYSQEVEFTSTSAGTSKEYTFSCNNIYDPDTTGGGHQPMFHDQYKLIYRRYRVIGAKIKVLLTGRETAGTQGVNRTAKVYIVCTDNDSMALGSKSITYLEEHPLTGKGRFVGVREGGVPVATTYSKFSPKRIFGRDHKDHSYSGLLGYAPAQQAKWHIAVVPIDPGTTLEHMYALVTINYIIEFSDMHTPNQS